jgi:hypothetical protein
VTVSDGGGLSLAALMGALSCAAFAMTVRVEELVSVWSLKSYPKRGERRSSIAVAFVAEYAGRERRRRQR